MRKIKKEEKVPWWRITPLEQLEKEREYPWIYRVISECGQIVETAVFTQEEKERNRIYCYDHKDFEMISKITKILL